MFDTSTTALLRAVFDEVCEAATCGEVPPEALKQVGRQALSQAPTMWR